MKSCLILLALVIGSTSAHAGSQPCTSRQAQWELDASLKFRHKSDLVYRDVGTATYDGQGKPTQYTFNFTAVSKDPQNPNFGEIGNIVMLVNADGTCDLPRYLASTSVFVETQDSYSPLDMMKDTEKKAP